MANGLTFVSYSRTDSDFALKLASDLRAQGADVWLDQLDIEAGARWDTAVEGALGRSVRLLVLLTPKSVASQNVLDEVSYALDEGKTVLPVLVEACAIPMRMRRLQHVDFTRGYEAGVARLLAALGVTQPSASTAAAPPAPETAPPARPAPAPEPAAGIERELAAQADPHVLRPATANRSRGVPIVPIAAGAVLLVAAVAWFSFGPSTATTSETPSEAIAGGPAATPSDPPAAAQPAPPVTETRATAQPQSAANTRSGSSPVQPETAPTRMPFDLALFKPTAPPSAAAVAAAGSDPGLQPLKNLAREFSGRSALSDSDLKRLGDAQADAQCEQADSSACLTASSNLVQSMFETVCARQAGPKPAGSDETARLLHDSKVLSCLQNYLSTVLNRMDERARDAIRHIKVN